MIKIFADGADASQMLVAYKEGFVKGFTTNPTLMKKSGVTDYRKFALKVLKIIKNVPISFEVVSDSFDQMEKEAREISSWGKNVYVKIPITNTKGDSSVDIIRKLSKEGLKLNITAILTVDQVRVVAKAVSPKTKTIVSVFAGRVADTGVDPIPLMKESVRILKPNKNAQLLWASPREILNLLQAEKCGCHIITMTDDLLKKRPMIGMDLTELSLQTVKMFFNDAKTAKLHLQL